MARIARGDFRKRTPEEELLLKLYKQASKDLVNVLATMPANPYRKSRENHLRMVVEILKGLDKETQKWVKKNIPKYYRLGIQHTSEQYKDLKEPDFKVLPFQGVNEKAVRILVDESYLQFGNTLTGVQSTMERALTQIQKTTVQNEIISSFISGTSEFTSKEKVVDQFRKQGITVFRAYGPKRTRTFTLNDYADILVRSQVMTAYNSGINARSIDAGRKFMRVSTVVPDVDGYDICNVHEGKIVDLTEKGSVLPPFHPRCRHILIPITFEDLKKEDPKLYESAVRYYRRAA